IWPLTSRRNSCSCHRQSESQREICGLWLLRSPGPNSGACLRACYPASLHLNTSFVGAPLEPNSATNRGDAADRIRFTRAVIPVRESSARPLMWTRELSGRGGRQSRIANDELVSSGYYSA